MLAALNNIRMLLLASWVGAAIFFSAAVAPGAFRVLRAANLPNAGELAGSIVSRTLSLVNTSGFILSLLLLITAFALRKSYSQRAFIFQMVLLVIVAVATAVGEWVIAARMRALRAGLRVAIDQLPASDPSRVVFNALHGYSVAALSIAIIAGLIAFFVIAARVKPD
ncbi:MAG: DUF4149 domain-containing protein [Acidobacteriota bacterium]|nr:DUF4149 domain-containing protein [Acidobacteriota bacterium]